MSVKKQKEGGVMHEKEIAQINELIKTLGEVADYLLSGWKRSLQIIIRDLEAGETREAKIYAEVVLNDLERREQQATVKSINRSVGWEEA